MAGKKSEKVEIDFNEPEQEKKLEPKKKPEIKAESTKETKEPDYLNFLEIRFSDDCYIKVPRDLSSVRQAVRILQAIEEELDIECFRPSSVMACVGNVEDEVIEPKAVLPFPQKHKQLSDFAKPVGTNPLSPIEEESRVVVTPQEERYDFCPLCDGKLKKKNFKKTKEGLKQLVVCKNRKCNFKREYVFGL